MLTISSTTISNNSARSGGGGGIGNRGFLQLKNSIVANNVAGDCAEFAFTSRGNNLASDGTCNLLAPGDLNNTNPMLGPLTNNGGSTETEALLVGSPAIDAIPLSDCRDVAGNPVVADQRGVTRPMGPACDIGAFEAAFMPPPTATPTVVSIRVGGVADVYLSSGVSPASSATSSRHAVVAIEIAALAPAVALSFLAGWWYLGRRLGQ